MTFIRQGYVSDLVYSSAVQNGMNLPKQIYITDCTTREGEQAADVSFSLEQKMSIIRRLAEMGIHQVQGGYPAKSRSDLETVQAIKQEQLPILVEAIAQVFLKSNWQTEVDRTLEAEPDVIDLQVPISDLRLKHVQRMSRQEMLEHSLAVVEYTTAQRGEAKTPIIRFAATDTTRADLSFLKEFYGQMIAAGAERITVADTAGAMTPAAMRYLIQELITALNVPIQVHCHNDYGLALPNILVAVEAGATYVDATINGLGERSGNASLDEVIMALIMLYGFDLDIDTSRLTELSAHVADLTGVPIAACKPLVGPNAFSHKLDNHVWGVTTHPPLYEPLKPEDVGNKRRIPIGKYTGPIAVRYLLKERNLTADDEAVDMIVKRIEEIAIERLAALDEATFDQIVAEVMG